MKRALIFGYLTAIHVALVAFVLNPQIFEEQRWRLGLSPLEPSVFAVETHSIFKALDRQAQDGSIILIGDSHFQRMPLDLLPEQSVNFGIGGDTVRHMVERVRDYRLLQTAKAIIIWGGYNDLLHRNDEAVSADMEKLIRILPEDKPIYLIGLVPVGADNRHDMAIGTMRVLDERFSKRCTGRCSYIGLDSVLGDDDGFLSASFDAGDGIHLNRAGYEAVAKQIASRMQ